MRSALKRLPELADIETKPGTPGNASFLTPKDFDVKKALDAMIADGVGQLKNYKVLD